MMGKLLISVWIGLALAAGTALAAGVPQTGKPITALSMPQGGLFHRGWTAEDGLPNDRVFKITQSPDGYLWLGTEGGLIRFDGMAATRLSQAPAGSEDYLIGDEPDGTLWLSRFRAKTGGLQRYRNGKQETFPLMPLPGRPAGARSTVLTVMKDSDQSLWVGFFFGGLMRVEASGKTKVFGAQDGFPASNKTVTTILRDKEGTLWVATSGAGIFSYRNGHFTQFDMSVGLVDDRVFSMAIDHEGSVWAGTTRGISVIRKGKPTTLLLSERDRFDMVNALFCDREGAMWIGTDGRGLFRYQEGQIRQIDEAAGLTNNVVRTIYQDREGNIWAGTRGGLDRFSQAAFTTISTADGLPTNSFGPILRDRNGDLWLAPLAGGLYRVRQGQIEDLNDLIGGDKILSMAEHAGGGLWLGRLAGGLSLLQNGRLKTWTTKDGLPINEINNLFEDRRGNLWLGLWNNGVARLTEGKVVSLGWKKRFPATVLVQGFAESANGDVWVADGVSGLVRIRGDEIRAFGVADGLAEGSVTGVYVDAQDQLWAAGTGGLSRQQGERFRTIGESNGLPLAAIGEMYQDDCGGFWLAGSGGIYRIAKRELDRVFEGKPTRVHLVKYGKSDGLLGTTATKFSHPLIIRMPGGTLWFVSSRGIAIVKPDHLPANKTLPTVVIERVKTELQTFESPSTLDLKPGTRRLQIEFTGLMLAAPESLRFRYRLEGFDKGWIEGAGHRAAEYTNLLPGKYRFIVSAAAGSGDWGPPSAPLAVEIEPYFYETGWFGLGCALALALSAVAAYLWRMRQMKARFDLVLGERIRIAREVHDTLLQGFAGIAWQLDSVSRSMIARPVESKAQVDVLLSQMDQCLAEARQAISTMRLPGNPMRRLEEMIQQTGEQLTGAAGLRFHLESHGAARSLPRDLEESLFCVAREAIVNSISHARASSVTVTIAFRRDEVGLTIADDGQGFDPRSTLPASGHWGVTGMRERVQQFGGELLIESQPGHGTIVRACVPDQRRSGRASEMRASDEVAAGD